MAYLTWMGSVLSGSGVPFGGWGVLLALMRDPPLPPFDIVFFASFLLAGSLNRLAGLFFYRFFYFFVFSCIGGGFGVACIFDCGGG